MKILSNASVVALMVSCAVGLAGPTALFASGPAPVDLLSAGNFSILAKTGVSTTGTTSIIGDVGISPAAASYLTGFALTLPTGGAYSTSALVNGKIYAPGYADPTAANITTAVSDMETAYTNAMGRTNPTATELGAGNIGGMTLAPGLYKWSTGVTIPTDVTLSGGANDVWIFQIAQNLDVSSGARVLLTGGAQARNIFWVVAGQTTIGTTAFVNGNILDQTAIVLNTGATLNGRALAQSAVTLDASTVVAPAAAPAATSAVTTVVSTTSTTTTTPSATSTNITPTTTTTTPTAVATSASVAAQVVNTSSTVDTGCSAGNKFSTVTGRNCVSVAATSNEPAATDVGCLSGNKFSTVTGKNCGSAAAAASAVAFGQQSRIFAKNLAKGNRDAEVKNLQEFLVSQNKGPAARALAKNMRTTYFGELTRAALAEFQASVGISPATGNFGPKTRAYMATHFTN